MADISAPIPHQSLRAEKSLKFFGCNCRACTYNRRNKPAKRTHMPNRLPSKQKLSKFLPKSMVTPYFSAYEAIKDLKTNDRVPPTLLKRLLADLHSQFCNAVEFLNERGVEVGGELFIYYTDHYFFGERFLEYEVARQEAALFPNRYYQLILDGLFQNRYLQRLMDAQIAVPEDLPIINACIAAYCSFLAVTSLGRLAIAHSDLIEDISKVCVFCVFASATTQSLSLPRIKKIATREQSGKKKYKLGTSWFGTIKTIDAYARKILRKAVQNGRGDRFEFRKKTTSGEGNILNKSLLADEIARQLHEENKKKEKTKGGDQAQKPSPPAEKNHTLDAQQIAKYLTYLYDSDLSVKDIIDHPFGWHFSRRKPDQKNS